MADFEQKAKEVTDKAKQNLKVGGEKTREKSTDTMEKTKQKVKDVTD